MGLDVSGIGAAVTGVKDILAQFFPDKSAEERDKAALALQLAAQAAAASAAQVDVDKAEAQSSDPLQHWRGAAGWVCVTALAWQFVLEPMTAAACAISHYTVTLPTLDTGPLLELMGGMLGLGTLHVFQNIKGKS